MIDRAKYLDKEEVRRLRRNAKNQYIADRKEGRITGITIWMLVDLALSTGLRVSELAAIKTEDIDFKRNLIKVHRLKRKKPHTESLMIEFRLKKHLKRYIQQTKARRKDGKLFVGQRGSLTTQGLQQIWKSAMRRAGWKDNVLSIHSARHTLAVHLLKKTNNLRQVQKQLGHANPVTTANFYADVSFEDMLDGVTGIYDN